MHKDPGSTKILLVCDNSAEIETIRLRLEEAIKVPCCVWHCITLAEGLDLLTNKKLHPDIIILDLGLIDAGNPKEVYLRMGDVANNIPIIALTGTGMVENDLATFVMEAGAADRMVRGQFDRLADAIEFALIRSRNMTKAREVALDKSHNDQQDKKNTHDSAMAEATRKSDERLLEKNRCILWMTGGYSVEDNSETSATS